MATILIVEDDAFIRQFVEMTIRDWGYDTLLARDADEALSFLRAPQIIDALFTDIYLKTAAFAGCELAHQAIRLRPTLRVLYTTGNYITDKIKAQFVEGTHCLRKPYTPHELQHSLEGLLAARPCGRAIDRKPRPCPVSLQEEKA